MKTMSNNPQEPVLIGSTFPLALIRRPVVISPQEIRLLRELLQERGWRSFWGHANTVAAAQALLGADLTPATPRPALTLSSDGLPSLAGETFNQCWVLSPDYPPGFRPQPNQDVPAQHITGWQVLRLEWLSPADAVAANTASIGKEQPA